MKFDMFSLVGSFQYGSCSKLRLIPAWNIIVSTARSESSFFNARSEHISYWFRDFRIMRWMNSSGFSRQEYWSGVPLPSSISASCILNNIIYNRIRYQIIPINIPIQKEDRVGTHISLWSIKALKSLMLWEPPSVGIRSVPWLDNSSFWEMRLSPLFSVFLRSFFFK